MGKVGSYGWEYDEVLWSIIRPVAIDVMNSLSLS